MAEEHNNNELFSDDPEEQLRIENEILKLKLQAELGGQFESNEQLPPDVENLFLKNVFEFEEQLANAPKKTISEILGRPPFAAETELSDEQIREKLDDLEELLEAKDITVDFRAEYSDRVKYKFITEELFQHVATELHIEGMMMHYSYEEFHPNHELSIKDKIEEFYNGWMAKTISAEDWLFSNTISVGEKYEGSEADFINKLAQLFESYIDFENGHYNIQQISFAGESDNYTGSVEGVAGYNAVLETGEVIKFNGQFQFLLNYNDANWEICSVRWPGLVIQNK